MNLSTNSKLPFITFIIVAYNEENYLGNLLDQYYHQDYPALLRELIIVNGDSQDDTKKIAQEFAQVHPELDITIFDNPKRTLAPGINIALRAARGDIVCRVDAHVAIPPDYLSKGEKLLNEKMNSGVACVGGPWQTVGIGFWGRAIAAVLSTPFGVGDAKFRYSKIAGFVDTVPCGFYWKWVFDKIGLYREDLVRTEDNELHARIRARGWKFYLSPELKTTYYCRSTIKDFLEQAFGNGYWSVISWRQSSLRHLVPLGFVSGLIFLGFASLTSAPFKNSFQIIILLYALSSFAVAIKSSVKSKEWLWILALPFLFFLMHTTYGIGSLWALFKSIFKLKIASIVS
jgi:glycosyltransferase involved in cell wall biosynthesis